MLPYLTEHFGNAASRTHAYGFKADRAITSARETIAKLLNAPNPESIIFTSGTTESNNWVIKSIVASVTKPSHFITQKTEHESVLEPCRFLESCGHEVTYLSVDASGLVNPDAVAAAIKKNTVLVSVMLANNEIGTIQPIREIVQVAHAKNVLVHTDAAQAVGKINVDVTKLDVDFMSFSAHKMYGPKGVGALYIADRKPKINLTPLLHGGGHEFGSRSGTVNVPGVVGLAKALEIAEARLHSDAKIFAELSQIFLTELKKHFGDLILNGPEIKNRLPGNLNVTLEHVDAGKLIELTPTLCFSSGAACSSGGTEPSHVLQAIGCTRDEAKQSVRFGLGRATTREDVIQAAQKIGDTAGKIREASLTYQISNPLLK